MTSSELVQASATPAERAPQSAHAAATKAAKKTKAVAKPAAADKAASAGAKTATALTKATPAVADTAKGKAPAAARKTAAASTAPAPATGAAKRATPATKAAKVVKAKKPKMVRDSFTIPKDEYDVLDVLKLRAAKQGNPVKKTELIRAGMKALVAMSDNAFQAAISAVPSLKTGRPAKGKKA